MTLFVRWKPLQQIFKLLRSVGISALWLYGCICLLLFSLQQRIIFHPTTTLSKTPAAFHLPYREVWLPMGAGQGIHGWWIPASRPSLGTLLYLHGNGINIGANVNQAAQLQRLGFSVLLIDYRGYGHSVGDFPSEASVYQDAERAWHYLSYERKIPPGQIFLYGHSLGGAVAIELAKRHPAAAGLIVQSSFTSMLAMAADQPSLRWLPIDLLLTQRFDSIRKVRSLQVPVLFIHGTADPVIPARMSKVLYTAAPQPKQLLVVPGAGHDNGLEQFRDPAYLQALRQFFERTLAKS